MTSIKRTNQIFETKLDKNSLYFLNSIHLRTNCDIKRLTINQSILDWIFRNVETSIKTFSILSNIYFDQLIHLVVLSHTSTFEQFPQPRLENFVVSFRYYYRIIVALSLSHTNGSFIVWLILCTMRLIPIYKHQLPTLKIIFIITIRVMLIWKNYSFDKAGPLFLDL